MRVCVYIYIYIYTTVKRAHAGNGRRGSLRAKPCWPVPRIYSTMMP